MAKRFAEFEKDKRKLARFDVGASPRDYYLPEEEVVTPSGVRAGMRAELPAEREPYPFVRGAFLGGQSAPPFAGPPPEAATTAPAPFFPGVAPGWGGQEVPPMPPEGLFGGYAQRQKTSEGMMQMDAIWRALLLIGTKLRESEKKEEKKEPPAMTPEQYREVIKNIL